MMTEQLQFLNISYAESFHAYLMEFFENKHYISMGSGISFAILLQCVINISLLLIK